MVPLDSLPYRPLPRLPVTQFPRRVRVQQHRAGPRTQRPAPSVYLAAGRWAGPRVGRPRSRLSRRDKYAPRASWAAERAAVQLPAAAMVPAAACVLLLTLAALGASGQGQIQIGKPPRPPRVASTPNRTGGPVRPGVAASWGLRDCSSGHAGRRNQAAGRTLKE